MTPVESLVALLHKSEAYVRRRNNLPASRFESQRAWLEPFFNLIGHALGQLLFLLPGPLRRRVHIWMCCQMEAHAPEAFPEQKRYQTEAVERAQALYRQTGHWPAVLFLTSHPATVGPQAWLRFELLRKSLWIADALVSASPHAPLRTHPQCFLAIDPYALDSVSLPVGGMYAGLMHSQYLVWDRQYSSQSWLQRHVLLAGTGHDRVAWRLLRALQRNPVLMVITGGLPANARLFYAVREWAGTLKDARKKLSKHRIRQRVMEILSSPEEDVLPAETGVIPPATQQRLLALLSELGYDTSTQKSLMDLLIADFKSDIPMRLRLWNVLYQRLVQRGIPLLVLPSKHVQTAPHVQLGPFYEITRTTDLAAFVKDFNAFYNPPLIK